MAYEQRDNSGSAFRSDRKVNESQPDLTGKAMIGGKMYYMSIWRKNDKSGNEFLSHAFKPVDDVKFVEAARPAPLKNKQRMEELEDSDLPDIF